MHFGFVLYFTIFHVNNFTMHISYPRSGDTLAELQMLAPPESEGEVEWGLEQEQS